MTALLIVVAAIVLLFIGYVFYGSWLAKQWGIDPTKKTPAIEKEDGVDYVAAKPAVLMGHHFHLSPEQARSTDRFRLPSSDGFPYSCGVSSVVFSSAVCRTSDLYSHLSDMTVNL